MATSPMLRQYETIKAQYPDCLLFFRLGDFYELFGEDAKIGAEVLHITLTARNKGADGKIAMCGVPFHASENYVARLVGAGYKVAICEQLTEAGKGLVEREVVRVVTAGTLLRDESLMEAESQYSVSFVFRSAVVGGAAADLSTGQFFAFAFGGRPEDSVPLILSHFAPREIVVSRETYDDRRLMALLRQEKSVNITCAHNWVVSSDEATKMLRRHFRVASLDAFGLGDKPAAVHAAAALLGYLHYTQKGRLAHMTQLREFHLQGHVVLNAATVRHLELLRTSEGEMDGSLFGVINRTVTAAGQRRLATWLLQPVTDRAEIITRQDAIGELVSRAGRVQGVHAAMGQLGDVERLVGRLAVGLGAPRDLRRLTDTLWHWHSAIVPQLIESKSSRLRDSASPLALPLRDWVTATRAKLIEEAKTTADEGYIFHDGVDPELSRLRRLTSGNRAWLGDFEAQERRRTGIPKLRVVFSRAFGYAVEVTKPYKSQVPPDYVPRQTLVHAERYICPALADYERQATQAMEAMIAWERQLFFDEVKAAVAFSAAIADVGQAIATLDILMSLARVAHENRYVRPTVSNEIGLAIRGGRHPVIEGANAEAFVANDTNLNPQQSLQLITGPNMAGKSTYIRQVALIVILAHIGSFVPAESATIGLTDRIFTRIGAHDNLRAGQSTFMVEMLETARILHNATARSLTLLDEVGRGTSPEDGYALAWAIAESLAKTGGLVLFATHFHNLKNLASSQPRVFNSHLASVMDANDLIFLRKVVDGPTDDSFGLVVAEKAGLPSSVIVRAKQVAAGAPPPRQSPAAQRDQLALPAMTHEGAIESTLRSLDLDRLTPLEALTALAKLKGQLPPNAP